MLQTAAMSSGILSTFFCVDVHKCLDSKRLWVVFKGKPRDNKIKEWYECLALRRKNECIEVSDVDIVKAPN